MNVIAWPQENGVLAVCIPTGHVPLETVLQNDVPAGVDYRIVSTDSFPVSLDTPLFDCVRRINEEYVVDIEAGKSIAITYMNNYFRVEGRKRSDNAAIGVQNDPDENTWLNYVQTERSKVTNCTTIQELNTILQPYLNLLRRIV